MSRIITIFLHEYWRYVTSRGYLLFTFGFPLLLLIVPVVGGAILALAIYLAMPPLDPRPIGMVDQAKLLGDSTSSFSGTTQDGKLVKVIFFPHSEEAAAALASDTIQAYYEIPPDYWQSGQVTLTYYTAPNELIRSMVTSWIEREVRRTVPETILQRLDRGPDISHYDWHGKRGYTLFNLLEWAIVYAIVYFVRLGGTSITANYMFDSIADEADDRTLEILLTSVSPLQFLLGKILGLLAVGFTQLSVWMVAALILMRAVGSYWNFDLIGFLFGWSHLWLMVSMLLGAYVLDHLLAATLGLLRVSGGAGMQLFGLINLFGSFGLLYATYFIPRNPHTTLAVLASLLPFTSPIVLLIRVVVSEVPTWQIAFSLILLWGTNFLAVFWLRRLLRANLVGKTPFQFWAWLKVSSQKFSRKGAKTQRKTAL